MLSNTCTKEKCTTENTGGSTSCIRNQLRGGGCKRPRSPPKDSQVTSIQESSHHYLTHAHKSRRKCTHSLTFSKHRGEKNCNDTPPFIRCHCTRPLPAFTLPAWWITCRCVTITIHTVLHCQHAKRECNLHFRIPNSRISTIHLQLIFSMF
eukprot:c25013_g2_i1 orf=240-692(+)